MDKFIDSRFERLEKALAGLIDSVNKYHPSTNQAKELDTADSELARGLEQVQTHQNNYIRIQELRKSSAALDTQIRDTLASLASTRKDIVSTPTTTFPAGPNHPFTYQELLNYARLISKTTLPSASALKAGLGAAPTPEIQTPVPDGTQQTGMTPSAGATPSNPQSPALVNGALSQQPATQQSSNIQLNPQVNEWLNPLSNQPFIPYPLEGAIRSGNLAAIQNISGRGIDPKGYDPAEEEARKQKEAEERREREEQERIELQEREKRQRDERERLRQEAIKQREKDQEAWRKGSITGEGGPAKVPEKKQFQFSSLDDLDDDDDDD